MTGPAEWLPEAPPPYREEAGFLGQAADWIGDYGYDYLVSALVHAIGMAVVMVVCVVIGPRTRHAAQYAPTFDAPDLPNEEAWEPQHYEVGEAPLAPSELTTESLTQFKYQPLAQTARFYDESALFEESGGGMAIVRNAPALGGLGGFNIKNVAGPGGPGGVGMGVGEGQDPGSGGQESGFGGRGAGYRNAMVGAFGGTKASERAVAAALNWLQRHQDPVGSWSLQHARRCVVPGCDGPGHFRSDSAATAMALLPFLAAGQTHRTQGPYQKTISKGIAWLIKHQRHNGDLSMGANQPMYAHGLATIALCEAYGLTRDSAVGYAARKAVRLIELAQCPHTAGWRYLPGQPGDMSVTGWQIMALKSAQMAGLSSQPVVLESARKFLQSCSKGQYGGLFCYTPRSGNETPTMTAVGMLCTQYLGTGRNDQIMLEGKKYLLENLPDAEGTRNVYYWYYATQVMHNFLGPEWDTWNRRMRRILIQTQERYGCGAGSWSPQYPTSDAWGNRGGRLYMTSLSALTLEVYYRYLPLFRIQGPGPQPDPAASQDVAHEADAMPPPTEKAKAAAAGPRG